MLGAAVFLAGAIGMETVDGIVLERNDRQVDDRFLDGTMLEELLEMTGLALALGAVISLVRHDPGSGSVRWDPALRGAPERERS